MAERDDWIQTFTGRKVFPLDLRPGDIHPGDIAHALAYQCRFAGHVKRFYSVAQHSVLVSRYLAQRGEHINVVWWGLFHDASEAYLCDVVRPLKRRPEWAFYREAEKRAQAVICEHFGLPIEEPAAVKHADLVLLATEARDVMAPLHSDWEHRAERGFEVLSEIINPLAPHDAEALFLSELGLNVAQAKGGGRG